jgi:internalin A
MFADAKLEDAVRTAIDKAGPLTADDIAGLTQLNAAGYQVADLGGIECFTEITDLNLGYGGGNSNVTDLTPLRYLKKLQFLDLNSNPLQTVEPLGELPSLQRLGLNNTSDSLDFTPLASAPALVRLDLESNTLGNLSPLGLIKTLREVWMNSSTLTAPNTLAVLTQVERLYLGGTQLTDATPLAGLTKLTELSVTSNGGLANFDKLSTLTNLTRLSAASNGLTNITAVGSMTKLYHLDLYTNQIVDISPIQGLLQLQELYLNVNQVTDITPLVNNAGLGTGDTVYLSNNPLNCQTQGANVTTLVNRGATVFSPCN